MITRVLLWFLLFCTAGASAIVAQTDKPVMQQSDPTAEHYFKNRKALVGSACRLSSVVNIGEWATNASNLIDENLNNYVAFNSAIDLSLVTRVICGVCDTKHHYAAGTKAGFHVLTSSDSKLLSLDVIKAFAISFYCEGELVGLVPIAPEVQVLQLDLISFSANNGATIDIEATAPAEYDEIRLQPGGGLNVDAVNAMKIQYAYVGDPYKYTLTNQGAGKQHGIEEFEEDYDRALTLKATYGGASTTISNQLIDADLTNGVSGNTLTLGNLICAVSASIDKDDPVPEDAPFKAGYNVGMHFTSGSLLNLGIGGTKTMELLDKDGKVLQTEHLNTTVLGLGLAAGGAGDNVITANQDFYGVKFTMAGVSVNLGAFVTHYFYVTPPPAVDHQCSICATANTTCCDAVTEFQLDHKSSIDVAWSLSSQPEGASATVDAMTGKVEGMTREGVYVFTATATDGCTQEVHLTRGFSSPSAVGTGAGFYNLTDETYVLSDDIREGASGSLIPLARFSDAENILNAQFDDYALYTGGLGDGDLMVCGIRTKDGSSMGAKKRLGFVVETTSGGVELAEIAQWRVRGYRAGGLVFDQPIEECDALSLHHVGTDLVQKMRLSTAIDEAHDIDEFQLWKCGAMAHAVSHLKLFCAFAHAAEEEDDESSLLISSGNTGARWLLSAEESDDMFNLIDDDPTLESYLTVVHPDGAEAVYAVSLGCTFGAFHQLGLVVDGASYEERVGTTAWLNLATYKDGEPTGESNDAWDVVGVQVVGTGAKRMLLMSPTLPYDELRITVPYVEGMEHAPKLYGIVARGDADRDGTPDSRDGQSCFVAPEELVLDEDAGREGKNEQADYNAKERDYAKARLVLHRNLTHDEASANRIWNSMVLPISLTGLQVRNAFGNDTRLAKAYSFESNGGEVVNFKRVPLVDDEWAIEAGAYYIIQTARQPEIDKAGTYVCTDGTQLQGEVYFINEVDYDQDNDADPAACLLSLPAGSEAATSASSIRLAGSYQCTSYPPGSYVFSGGQLYQQVSSHKINAFRFWIEELMAGGNSGAHALSFQLMDEQGGCTQITPLCGGAAFVEADESVCNLAGQRMGGASVGERLPKGVYVVRGRKVLK